MSRFHSEPLDLPPPDEREEVARADLIFYGVDHSGPSYEARIFLDNPRASEETPCTAEEGYAGSFTVFGHGGCFGADGHCAPSQRNTDEYDRRPPHPLTPQTVAVEITPALARVEANAVKVNVIAVVPAGQAKATGVSEIPPPERIRIATYA